MDIFNNHQLSGYEELKSYGPRYYDNIAEMDANYKFAGYTVDLMADGLDSLIDNQFITSMDAKHLEKLISFLNIIFNNGEKIDEKRKVVLVAWNSEGKVNRTKIIDIIKLYVGEETQVSVVFENETLTIAVNSLLSDQEINAVIENYLSSNIPSHIKYQVIYINPNYGMIYMSGGIVDGCIETIRQVI